MDDDRQARRARLRNHWAVKLAAGLIAVELLAIVVISLAGAIFWVLARLA